MQLGLNPFLEKVFKDEDDEAEDEFQSLFRKGLLYEPIKAVATVVQESAS